MKRFLWLATLALFCPLALIADERILNYRSDIQVHSDGRLTVTETIRVRAEGNQVNRGIYRDFPTRYKDKYGNRVKVDFQVNSVRRNGNSEPWHTKDRNNGVRIYAGSANRVIEHGVHEYEIVFETNRQLGFFEKHDELYFNAIGTGWVFPIDRAEVTVSFPFQTGADQLVTDLYLGSYGSSQTGGSKEVLDGSTVRFSTDSTLPPREGLTFAVTWPKGMIAEPDTMQKARWFFADNGGALILLPGFLLTLGWYGWAWNKAGRDPDKGVIIPRYRPPEGLSPAACRYVKSMSFKRDCFTAAIISLAVKGQLSIEEEKKKKFTLVRTVNAPVAELTKGESAVLNELLPTAASRIKMENENHAEFQKAQTGLKKALKAEYLGRLFHLNGWYILPAVLVTIGTAVLAATQYAAPLLLILFIVLSLVLHGLFIFLMRAPTPAGRRIMDEIEGFGMYLGTAEQDRLDRMQSPEMTPEVFESFLPYAYALGVENKWCDRFAREMPREMRERAGYHPAWYSGHLHGAGALHHLGDNFSSTFSSAIASASAPPGSSSGGGGGGFSGGGGGGGGGGGW